MSESKINRIWILVRVWMKVILLKIMIKIDEELVIISNSNYKSQSWWREQAVPHNLASSTLMRCQPRVRTSSIVVSQICSGCYIVQGVEWWILHGGTTITVESQHQNKGTAKYTNHQRFNLQSQRFHQRKSRNSDSKFKIQFTTLSHPNHQFSTTTT
jgi:hypothetical protein